MLSCLAKLCVGPFKAHQNYVSFLMELWGPDHVENFFSCMVGRFIALALSIFIFCLSLCLTLGRPNRQLIAGVARKDNLTL